MPKTFSDDPKAWVKNYYGEVLKHSGDLKTNACCATGAPPKHLLALLKNVHPDILARFYGCGFPIPEALEGKTIVDLGCGTGRDVFMLAQLAKESGHVYGIDMTEAQLEVARAQLSWHSDRFGFSKSNVSLCDGYIEDLKFTGLADASVDVFVSNCVVNLSPRKDLVLGEVYRLLKNGGEFYLSDVVVDRRLPENIVRDPLLYSECLSGAIYDFDFEELAKKTGFLDPREVSRDPIEIGDAAIQEKVGSARFYSVTYRLLKLPELEARCEDYGQVATYQGGLLGSEVLFKLDDHHIFEAGRPERVCGNTAAMLKNTRFAAFFEVVGNTQTHFGAFDCSATMASDQYQSRAESSSPSTACC